MNGSQLSPQTSNLRVGFGLAPGDPFWVQVREAVQQRADELDLTLVPIAVPTALTGGDTQLRFLEDLKAQELGALISHVVPESLMLAILNEGLPIVCSEDTTLVHPLFVSVHGLDQAATLAAEYVTERLAGSGQLLMVGAVEDRSQTAQLRIQGFRQVLARYPAMRCVHVGAAWRYEETVQQLLEEAGEWLAEFPEGRIDAIFGLSDPLALAARDVGLKLGIVDSKTVVVGINGDPLAIAAVEAGTMHATVDTSPQDLGSKLAEFSQRAARREALPDHFPYAFQLVTAANVSQVAARKLVALADLPSRLVDVNQRLEQQRLVQMEASLELNLRVGSILDQQELLATMAEIVGTRYAYDRVQFFFWSHTERTLVLAQEAANASAASVIPLAHAGSLGDALLHNQVVYIPDVFHSKRYLPDPRWPDVHSRVILPVHVGGRILGVLDLHSRQRTLRNQVELDALQTLADELGAAMRNAQHYAQAVQARAEAVQASLLKSRLLANVSHQLRTPLNVILGYSQAALATPNPYATPLPAELIQDLRYIERSGADLQRLVNDLLDLAQAEAGTLQLYPEQIDARSFLQEVFDAAVRTLAGDKEVRWKLQAAALLPPLAADPVRLRHMLLNLLDNAIKFTERGQIVLGAEAAAAHLHLWVQDTGCGMAPELVARLRQNLTIGATLTGNRTADGSNPGLGLAIVHHLVLRHGGEFQIESEQGRGTTCHIWLPLGPAPGAAHGQELGAHRQDRGTLHQRKRVTEELVAAARTFIAHNFATPFTREQIAAALGVSPAYVSRIFRQQTGRALWDYVNEFRVARACELLDHSDMTVTEIAFAVGFSDAAYFSRVFHNTNGKSPASYRASSSD